MGRLHGARRSGGLASDRAVADVAAILATFEEDAVGDLEARFCALRTLSPSAVTHSTRPPAVTIWPSFDAVLAWKTCTSSCSTLGRPVMTSPLRGFSG